MSQKLPQHVAIVMDGNGRWAENRGLPRVEGHRVGINAVKAVVKSCLEKEIAILSLFAFSSENWARPEMEVDFLMQLFIEALENEMHELNENGIRLFFSGAREQLSAELQKLMQNAEALTCDNKRLMLNIVVNYSGKWDIIQAALSMYDQLSQNKLLREEINEATFAKLLNTHNLPDPDLFIRTSGEQRISNFFLWQLAYTELYFTDIHWPDFTALEFEKALTNFSTRERRYGQIAAHHHEKGHV